MIRTAEQGNPKRRIAIIAIPRPQKTRLGVIRTGWPARDTTEAWTTIADETPDSSANWISYKLMDQAVARQTTPGTLTYTPASATPAQNVAPWNSWLSPNCPPQPYADDSGAVIGTAKGRSWLWIAAGILGGVASLKYIATNGRR